MVGNRQAGTQAAAVEAGMTGAAAVEAGGHTSGIPPLRLITKIAYGFGAVAHGVKDQGYNYFLMFFYSAVMGLDAGLAGLAIFLALILDAISDPLVGYVSDNFHSRWGRRHPFMYASVIPLVLGYYFVWTPPEGMSQMGLFGYLLAMAVITRTFITFYQVPSTAMMPELTDDYDQRTDIMSYRYFFGWLGGAALSIVTLAFFLVPTDTISNGYFNVQGYRTYGFVASSLILLSVLTCSIATHSRIKYMRAAPPKEKKTVRAVFGEIFETLANRSFLVLFVAALFGAAATGVGAGLNHYLMGFFWGFSPQQVSGLQLALFISCVVALVLSQVISRKLGKKQGALLTGGTAMIMTPMPYILRLTDMLPANGEDALFYFILIFQMIDVALIITAQILMSSMIGDIVEQSELKTGRRSEGMFFAAISFSKKCTLGLGGFMVAIILSLSNFPEGAQPDEVSQAAIDGIGFYYIPVIFGLWLAMMLCVAAYSINRSDHEANLAALKARERGE